MQMNIRFILFSFLLLIAFAVSVFAKDDPEVEKKTMLNVIKGVDPDLREKINFARRLIKNKNYEGASAYLETLYENDRSNAVIQGLLKQCYEKQKLYTKYEDLIRRQIGQNPNNISFWVSLAEVTVKQGRIDEALKHYRKAESLIEGKNRVRFQIVIQSMLFHQFESEVQTMIEKWRRDLNEPQLLALQLGQVFERQKEYLRAVTEYYPILFDTARTGNDAEKRIVNLLLFEDSAPIVEDFLLNQESLYDNYRALKILSSHYLRSGQLKEAFEFTKKRDSIEHLNGSALIMYMQNCNQRKLYNETLKMGRYLNSQIDRPEIKNRAGFIYAEALIQLLKFEDAVAVFDTIFLEAKSKREKADALYHIGKVYQENLFKFDKALIYYDSVKTSFPLGLSYLNTMVAVPYCYLQQGKLQKADREYSELLSRRLNTDIKEKVAYYLALIKFYNKQVDSSRTAFSKLMIDFPKGYFVNDALEIMKIIDEGKDAPVVLYDYSNALFFETQHKPDSQMAKLDQVAINESKVLADLALYKLYQLTMSQADTLRSIEYIDQLTEKFPESYYVPYGLKQKADMYNVDEKKADEAIEIYRHLLETFPDYPFISEIRTILRTNSEKEGSA